MIQWVSGGTQDSALLTSSQVMGILLIQKSQSEYWDSKAFGKFVTVYLKQGEENSRAWDGWMAHWFSGHELGQTPGGSEVKDREAGCAAVHGVKKTLLSHWTKTMILSHDGGTTNKPLMGSWSISLLHNRKSKQLSGKSDVRPKWARAIGTPLL